MAEPMSDERLAEIRQRAESVKTWKGYYAEPVPQLLDVDVPALLAEVERLREYAEEAAKAVAAAQDQAVLLREEIGALKARAARAERERDEARAEAERLREALADTDLGAQVLAQWEAIAAADADRDRLQAEVDQAQTEAAAALSERDEARSLVERLQAALDEANFMVGRQSAALSEMKAERDEARAEAERLRSELDRHTEYQCPQCWRWAPWTDGKSVRSGDEADEFWCQNCGTESPLTACSQRLVVDGLKAERDEARDEAEKLRAELERLEADRG